MEITERSVLSVGPEPVVRVEKIAGIAHFEFDPAAPSNAAIVDLNAAPRNVRGRVEAQAGFMVLRPLHTAKAPGTVIFEVSNRGGKALLPLLHGAAPSDDPSSGEEFGDGLLLRAGIAVAWLGWQFDVPPGAARLRLEAPRAGTDAEPLAGWVRADWVVDAAAKTLPLGHRGMVPYAPARPADPRHRLTRRAGRDGARLAVPRDHWHYSEEGTAIRAAGTFEAGYVYELTYVAELPAVVGLGLAAVRDFVSALKRESPLGAPATHVVGFGVSQAGRFLRHFLYAGFNRDGRGAAVFDGLMIHAAGAGRGSFNHRYAQPSRDAHRYSAFDYPTDVFPFTSRTLCDPVSRVCDGLAAGRTGIWPKIMYTQTGYEYWGRAAALTHTAIDRPRDVEPLPSERIYHLASAQHFPARLPAAPLDPTAALPVYGGNPLDVRPNLRALLLRLVDWVESDREPPPSQFPRYADGTLVPLDRYALPRIPGVAVARVAHTPARLDFGPRWRQGIIDHEPAVRGPEYPVAVPQADAYGNEMGGIRNVDVAAPLGTYLPWQLRGPARPPAGELVDFLGTFVPLANDRLAGDQRPDRTTAYRNVEDYAARVDAALDALVAAGHVRFEDRDRVRADALRRWHGPPPAAAQD